MDLIIGAGVSGLTYAAKSKEDYLVLEKENEIGGYCRTIKQDGFIWDYSGHFFHFKNEQVKDWILNGIDGEVLDVEKESGVHYKGVRVDFPFQKNIHQLPKEEFIECLVDLYYAGKTGPFSNFYEMLEAKFGKAITGKFLAPYNEKLYACDLKTLDSDAMGRFFPYASFKDTIDNMISSDNASYNAKFTYPREGAIMYVNSIAKHVKLEKVQVNRNVTSIDPIAKVLRVGNDVFSYQRLISSMPLPSLLNLCNYGGDVSSFSWNKVLVFNLGFNKKGLNRRDHWMYFPEKEISFYRVGFYDNIFGDSRLSMYVEIGLSQFQKRPKEEVTLKAILKDLKKTGIIDDSHELLSYKSILMDPAYVHVSGEGEEAKLKAKSWLQNLDIYSIGRYGDWKYCSIEDNMIEAIELQKKLQG